MGTLKPGTQCTVKVDVALFQRNGLLKGFTELKVAPTSAQIIYNLSVREETLLEQICNSHSIIIPNNALINNSHIKTLKLLRHVSVLRPSSGSCISLPC